MTHLNPGMQRLAVMFLLIACCSAHPAFASGAMIPDDVRDAVRSLVDTGEHVGIAVGLVTLAGTEFFCYGHQSLSRERPISERTLFEVGSVGKTFTASLLAALALRGDVALTDPVRRYLPETVTLPTRFGREITLEHLATHTSGLPSIPENLDPADWDNPYADYTVDQMYEFLSSLDTVRIGEYEYSNLAMGLLGHVLALHAGMSYEELIVETLGIPLGLPDTCSTLTLDQQNRTATGHNEDGAYPRWDIPTLAGAGALLSTAADLTRFVAAHLGLVETPLANALQMTHAVRVPGAMPVGLGWHMRITNDKTIVEHHGATGGNWSYVGFVTDEGRGVVVLANTYANIDSIGIHLIDANVPLDIAGATP